MCLPEPHPPEGVHDEDCGLYGHPTSGLGGALRIYRYVRLSGARHPAHLPGTETLASLHCVLVTLGNEVGGLPAQRLSRVLSNAVSHSQTEFQQRVRVLLEVVVAVVTLLLVLVLCTCKLIITIVAGDPFAAHCFDEYSLATRQCQLAPMLSNKGKLGSTVQLVAMHFTLDSRSCWESGTPACIFWKLALGALRQQCHQQCCQIRASYQY